MALIVAEGIVLLAVVYAPILVYVIWSWHFLKRQSRQVAGGSVCLGGAESWVRLLAAAVIVAVLWALIASASAPPAVLLSYSLDGDRLRVARCFLSAAYLPLEISSWAAGLLWGDLYPSYSSGPDWLVGCGTLVGMLSTISLVQWLFIRRARSEEELS